MIQECRNAFVLAGSAQGSYSEHIFWSSSCDYHTKFPEAPFYQFLVALVNSGIVMVGIVPALTYFDAALSLNDAVASRTAPLGQSTFHLIISDSKENTKIPYRLYLAIIAPSTAYEEQNSCWYLG